MLVQVILIRIENYSFVKNYGSSISWFLRVAGNVPQLYAVVRWIRALGKLRIGAVI